MMHDKSIVEQKITLNHYVAGAGVCSRRQAGDLIKSGQIFINGIVTTKPFYRVLPEDIVEHKNIVLKQEKYIYILLNKPQNCLSTTTDDRQRKTVLDFIKIDKKHRIYPVGRLDFDTTGLMIITNDGNLTQKLLHPKNEVAKVYHVTLNKTFDCSDLLKIKHGIELEDGLIAADTAFHLKKKNQVSIEIHSGKNRIIKRIFNHLGYQVLALDRASIAGLKEDSLTIGKWRFLRPDEIQFLKKY
jgi:23S rRNA pseudouridine2605 synthase